MLTECHSACQLSEPCNNAIGWLYVRLVYVSSLPKHIGDTSIFYLACSIRRWQYPESSAICHHCASVYISSSSTAKPEDDTSHVLLVPASRGRNPFLVKGTLDIVGFGLAQRLVHAFGHF